VEKLGEEFEVLAEWVIRKLRVPEGVPEEKREEIIKRWVLYSLGLDKLAQDIYLFIEQRKSVTSTEIAKHFNISPNTARKYLDDLHTLGLVDYIGREYRLEYDSLAKSIKLVLIPRIRDTLRTIVQTAKLAEKGPSYVRVEVEEGEKVDLAYVSSLRITNDLLEEWLRKGRRVRIKSIGVLEFAEDVDPDLAERVIDRIHAIGPIKIPTRVYTALSDRIKVIGPISFYSYSRKDYRKDSRE